jgi:hypothetical protein
MGNCISKSIEHLSIGTSNELLTDTNEKHVLENKQPKKEIKEIIVNIILLSN